MKCVIYPRTVNRWLSGKVFTRKSCCTLITISPLQPTIRGSRRYHRCDCFVSSRCDRSHGWLCIGFREHPLARSTLRCKCSPSDWVGPEHPVRSDGLFSSNRVWSLSNVLRSTQSASNCSVTDSTTHRYSELSREAAEFIEPRPPASWPEHGAISVENLIIRYAVIACWLLRRL